LHDLALQEESETIKNKMRQYQCSMELKNILKNYANINLEIKLIWLQSKTSLFVLTFFVDTAPSTKTMGENLLG
jgi:hypothetical protein